MNNDLISRQAMLDGIDKLIKIHFDRTVVLYKARKVAEDLPSAQSDVIRCKDCVNYIDNRCVVADHHVAPFSCCQSVFNAKNRGEEE